MKSIIFILQTRQKCLTHWVQQNKQEGLLYLPNQNSPLVFMRLHLSCIYALLNTGLEKQPATDNNSETTDMPMRQSSNRFHPNTAKNYKPAQPKMSNT